MYSFIFPRIHFRGCDTTAAYNVDYWGAGVYSEVLESVWSSQINPVTWGSLLPKFGKVQHEFSNKGTSSHCWTGSVRAKQ